LDVKPKTTGEFYRDDAARLVSAAAVARQAPPVAPGHSGLSAPRRTAPAPVLDEPDRPPLRPDPASNENRRAAAQPAPAARSRRNLPRLLARIVIAPFYVAVALAAIGVIVLFAKGLFGL
jgi:hypothetical protein